MPQIVLEKKRKRWPVAVAAVACALIAIGVIFWFVYQSKQADDAEKYYHTSVQRADGYMRLLQYDDAIRTYKEVLATKPTAAHTYRLQILIAQTYQQQGKNAEALQWFQTAEKSGTTYNKIVWQGIAETAQQLGQKELSIENYKKAIAEERKSTSPGRFQEIQDYESGIRGQGGTP